MSDKPWIAIDPTELRMPVEQRIGSTTVTSSTSPYSVPQALSTYADKRAGDLVLEVKYIGPDEPMEVLAAGNASVSTGRNSGRLFRVAVHAPLNTDRDQFILEIKKAIASVADVYTRLQNYQIVTAAIDKNKLRLVIEGIDDEDTEK